MKSLSFSVSLLSLPPLSLLSDLPYRDPVHRPGPPGDARRALLDRGDELRGQLVDRREVAGFRRERPLLPQDLAAVGDRRRARGAGAARARAAPASSASAPSFSAPSSSKEPVELPRARADVNDPPSFHQQRQQSRRHAPRTAVVCVDRLLGLGAAPGVALEGDGGVVDEDGDCFLFFEGFPGERGGERRSLEGEEEERRERKRRREKEVQKREKEKDRRAGGKKGANKLLKKGRKKELLTSRGRDTTQLLGKLGH